MKQNHKSNEDENRENVSNMHDICNFVGLFNMYDVEYFLLCHICKFVMNFQSFSDNLKNKFYIYSMYFYTIGEFPILKKCKKIEITNELILCEILCIDISINNARYFFFHSFVHMIVIKVFLDLPNAILSR